MCAFPYILAFTQDSIEIRLIINGNLVQTMVMPKLAFITSKVSGCVCMCVCVGQHVTFYYFSYYKLIISSSLTFEINSEQHTYLFPFNLTHRHSPLPCLQSDIFFATTAPESFTMKRERVKVDRLERDPSLSPPPSPHGKEHTGKGEREI